MLTRDVHILVVDDHAMMRDMLCDHLGREPGFGVVGSAETAEQAIDLLQQVEADVIVMDVDMPGLSSFEAARSIAWMRPRARIIFVSAFHHDRYIEQALAVSARGYLTKREPPGAIAAAIREVAAGGVYFSDEVRARIVFDFSGPRLGQGGGSRAGTLTTRQIEVLRYIARGLSKKKIAALMHISVKTVDRHSANLMDKLAIHDRVELTRFAIREGWAEA